MKPKQRQGHAALHKGYGAQDRVLGILKDWGWSTAQPVPDHGGDAICEIPLGTDKPSVAILVQIKSSEHRRRSVSLKNRSAKYLAEHDLPSFVFYWDRLAERLKWVSLDSILESALRAKPNGDVAIRLPERAANPREACPPDLLQLVVAAVKRRAVRKIPDIAAYADAQRQLFAEIDPKLSVLPTFDGKRKGLAINPLGPDVDIGGHFQVVGAQAIDQMRGAFDWGREAAIQDCKFEVTGSPIFQLLGMGELQGTLIFTPDPAWAGQGLLEVLTDDGAVFARSPVAVSVRRGARGVEVDLSVAERFAVIRTRFSVEEDVPAEGDISIGFENGKLGPIELARLRGGHLLLTGLLRGDHARLALFDHPSARDPLDFRWRLEPQREGDTVLFALHALNALDDVCGRLQIDVPCIDLDSCSGIDFQNWIDALALLNGEELSLKPNVVRGTAESTSKDLDKFSGTGIYAFGDGWPVRVMGNAIAEIDGFVVCRDYTCTVTSKADGRYELMLEPAAAQATRSFSCKLPEPFARSAP